MSARALRGRERPAPSAEAGFTLIEVLVAIVLLSIAVMGVAGLAVAVAQANRGATNRTRADQLVHAKVEELYALGYEDIDSGADTVDVGGVLMVREWTVNDGVPLEDMKQIVLVARWSELGSDFSQRTATLIGRY